MRMHPIEDRESRERLLGLAMLPLADDLRLLDFEHFVAVPGNEASGNVESLVRSSIELAFKPGTVEFVRISEVALAWGRQPQVTLVLELHHRDVHTYFRLRLEARTAAVEIDFLTFDRPSSTAKGYTAHLAASLAGARRPGSSTAAQLARGVARSFGSDVRAVARGRRQGRGKIGAPSCTGRISGETP